MNTAQLPARTTLPQGYFQRILTIGDIGQLAELERHLFPDEAWNAELLEAEITGTLGQHPTHHYLGIVYNDAIVAYAGSYIGLPFADLQTIGVTSPHRGHGLAIHLLIELMYQARSAGARDMLLEVRADNDSAQKLYRRFDFEHIHTRPKYYRGGVDALLMRRPLKDRESTAADLSRKL